MIGNMKDKAHVILYSKPGCHLCEVMKAEMTRAGCNELYELEEINIESDPALLARYRNEIPILLIDRSEVFKHRLSADAFREYLTHLRK
jgi:glutaredoxin